MMALMTVDSGNGGIDKEMMSLDDDDDRVTFVLVRHKWMIT